METKQITFKQAIESEYGTAVQLFKLFGKKTTITPLEWAEAYQVPTNQRLWALLIWDIFTDSELLFLAKHWLKEACNAEEKATAEKHIKDADLQQITQCLLNIANLPKISTASFKTRRTAIETLNIVLLIEQPQSIDEKHLVIEGVRQWQLNCCKEMLRLKIDKRG